MRAWADDPAVGAVMLDGAGGRAFAPAAIFAHSTTRRSPAIHCPSASGRPNIISNVLIARYRKPVIAIMDGVVMGGGVGLSSHAAHRVVTERSSVAMPEVGIGFFPDVGVAFLLARAPGAVGTHLAADRRPHRRGGCDLLRSCRYSRSGGEACRSSGGACRLPLRRGGARPP